MDSHYWYFIVDNDDEIAVVYKKQGWISEGYKFINDVPSNVKTAIESYLKEAPVGNRYTFAYHIGQGEDVVAKCIKIEISNVCNGVDLWESMPADGFFDITRKIGIPVPDTYTGDIVFKDFKGNIDDGTLVKEKFFFKVKSENTYVYPLKAV